MNIKKIQELKDKARLRDHHTCQECGRKQKEFAYKMSVHHKDFNPHHDALSNYITLCIGCHRKKHRKPYRGKNLKGKIFERLTVVQQSKVNPQGVIIIKRSIRFWKCLCLCGNIKIIAENSLLSGATKSCGCLSREMSSGKKPLGRMKSL